MTRFNLAIAIVLDVARRLQVAACQPVNRHIDYHIIDINKINNCYTCVSSPCNFPLEELSANLALSELADE